MNTTDDDPRTDLPPTGPLFVPVHGAWHGSWCWAAVRTGRLPGMHDDAEAIGEVLAPVDRPVVLVAHSYGGTPAAQAAAANDNAAQLVHVAAFALRPGECLVSRSSGGMPDDDVLVADDHTQELLFSDLDAEQRGWAGAQLTPQGAQAFRDPVTARRDTLRSAYVLTGRDQIMPPEFQQAMAAGTDVVRHVDGGHSAWLSAPAALAGVLADLAGTPAAATPVHIPDTKGETP